MQGLLSAQQSRGEHDDADEDDDECKLATERYQTALQGGLDSACFIQQSGDTAELGVHPCRYNQTHRATVSYEGSLVREVAAIPDGNIRLCNRCNDLVNRSRLARQRGFIQTQARNLDQAKVRGDNAASLQKYDIAGNQFGGSNRAWAAASYHLRRGSRHRLQRSQGALRPEFLCKSEHGIENHDRYNDQGVGEITDCSRYHGRADQDQDHEVLELRREDRDRGARWRLDVHIRTVARASVRGVLGAQSFAASRQQRVGLLGGVLIPGDVLGV